MWSQKVVSTNKRWDPYNICSSPDRIIHVIWKLLSYNGIAISSCVLMVYYNVNNLSNLFTNVAGDTILKILKEINLYTKV
jgi:hypothetical protein